MQKAPVVYSSLMPKDSLKPFEVLNNLYLIGSTLLPRPGPRLVMGQHGAGRVRSGWVTSLSEAQDVLDANSRVPLDVIGESIRGSLTLYILDESRREITILTDPLGGGLVYTHTDEDGTAVSSDLNALVGFLGLIGKRARKSLAYVATYMATGSGGIIDSSYENISTFKSFEYAVFNSNGLTRRYYRNREQLFEGSSSPAEQLEAAALEIRDNVEVAMQHRSTARVAHLTGGVDSRLLYGAIQSLDLQHDVSFYCAGGEADPDQIVARSLSAHFRLTMTEHSGLEGPTVPETLEQQLLEPLLETGGIISGPASSRLSFGDDLVLSGGYGELLRSFYSRGGTFGDQWSITAEDMYGKVGYNREVEESLLSAYVMDETHSKLRSVVDEGRSIGVRNDALLDYVYLTRRNRYYVGEISRSLSPFAARFDPLYSLNAISLGMGTPGELRNANIPGFDLMNSFDNTLSSLPFDTDRFNSVYETERGPLMRKAFLGGGDIRYDGRMRQPPVNMNRVRFPRPTEEDINLASKLRTSPRLVAQYPSVVDGLKEMILSIPASDFDSIFNRKVVNRLLGRRPSNRQQIRSIVNLYAGLLWYTNKL